MTKRVPWQLAALVLLFGTGANDPRDLLIEVDAGTHDRRDTLVHFPLPAGSRDASAVWTAHDLATGKPVFAQRDRDLIFWTLSDPLAARAKRRYRLTAKPAPGHGPAPLPASGASASGNTLTFASRTGMLELQLDRRIIMGYHQAIAEPPTEIDPVFRRSGFIHPLTTPSGLVVTDDFPPDHAHQHGVFFAWVNTTFDGRHVDFWNQKERTGRVGHAAMDNGPTFDSGPVAAVMNAVPSTTT